MFDDEPDMRDWWGDDREPGKPRTIRFCWSHEPEVRSDTPRVMTWFGLIVVGVVLLIIFGCGVAPPPAPAATLPPVTFVTVPPSTAPVTSEISAPADAPPMAAFRVDPPTTVPPDPCDVAQWTVNALPYEWLNLGPVHTAYRLVAMNCLGWDQATTDKWEAFIVDDVIRKESGGCWNLLRKGVVHPYLGCVTHYPNGAASDAGFFQIVGSNYAPGTWLCAEHGFCDAQSIIGAPFPSMLAGLLFVMYDGSHPWCYDGPDYYHWGCRTVTRNWP